MGAWKMLLKVLLSHKPARTIIPKFRQESSAASAFYQLKIGSEIR
jgi:hypothetical protein